MNQSEIAAAAQEFEAAQARGEYFPRAWFDRLAHWEFAEAQFEAAQGRSQPWRFNLAA